MTGWADATMPISRMTIASLADIGYVVDMSQADAYRLPANSSPSLQLLAATDAPTDPVVSDQTRKAMDRFPTLVLQRHASETQFFRVAEHGTLQGRTVSLNSHRPPKDMSSREGDGQADKFLQSLDVVFSELGI